MKKKRLTMIDITKYLLLYQLLTLSYSLPAQQITVERINKEILMNEIKSKPTFKYHLVCIFTNKCIGTKYMFERIKLIESKNFTNTNIILCSSSRERHAEKTKKVVQESGTHINRIFVIDKTKYREKLLDDREKGFLFRKDICEACREHVIGVPYTIIFNSSGEVCKFGYLGPEEIMDVLKN